jgi:hypothetical protein
MKLNLDQNDSKILIRTLAEELLKEKKERTSRLEKELTEAKKGFLSNSNSKAITERNRNTGYCSCDSSQRYCQSCGRYEDPEEKKNIRSVRLDSAITAKEFLLRGECKELANRIFKENSEEIKDGSEEIFTLLKRIHECRESVKKLEDTISKTKELNEETETVGDPTEETVSVSESNF